MKRKKDGIIYLNGAFVSGDKAKISVFDRGLLYGDGLFETMRSYSGYVFRLDEHLRRLFASCKILGIRIPFTKKQLKEGIYKTLRKNGFSDAYIRLTVTRGQLEAGFDMHGACVPNVFIITRLLKPYPARLYNKGVRAITTGIKQNESSPASYIKSLNYLDRILIKNDIKRDKVQEAILTNTKGYLTEGISSNIFLVKDNILMTPSLDSGILQGITRGVVLEIAKKLKLKIKVNKILPKEIFKADEIFLSNSVKEIVPVVQVNKRRIASGQTGKVTKSIQKLYEALVAKEKKG